MGILDAVSSAMRSPAAQEAAHALAQIGYAFGQQPVMAAREAQFLDQLRSKERFEEAMRKAGLDPSNPASWTAEGIIPALVQSGAVTPDDVAKTLIWKLEELRGTKESRRLEEEKFGWAKSVTEQKLGPEIEKLRAETEKELAYADYLRKRALVGEGGGAGGGTTGKLDSQAMKMVEEALQPLELMAKDETLPPEARYQAARYRSEIYTNFMMQLASGGGVDPQSVARNAYVAQQQVVRGIALGKLAQGKDTVYDQQNKAFVTETPLGTVSMPLDDIAGTIAKKGADPGAALHSKYPKAAEDLGYKPAPQAPPKRSIAEDFVHEMGKGLPASVPGWVDYIGDTLTPMPMFIPDFPVREEDIPRPDKRTPLELLDWLTRRSERSLEDY